MAKKQPELALSVGVRSERGRRDDNQDKMSAFSTPLGMVYVVADGMGGYRGGAEASRRVVEGFQRHLNGTGFTESINLKEQFQRAAQQTNAEILAESSSGDPTVEGMGSTVVLALLRSTPGGMQMLTAHIGDSRGYLLREGTLYRITRDHSMVQRMVDTGLLTSEQARNHPESNVLSRAIGKQPTVEIEIGDLFQMNPGDVLLLCSDGLWGPLTEQQIGELLGRHVGTQEIADALVNLALECGSDDNITVQVVRYEFRGLGARSAALFSADSKNASSALPPPGVVAKHDLGPKPKPGKGGRKLSKADLFFGALGVLGVAALFAIGYHELILHRQVTPVVDTHRSADKTPGDITPPKPDPGPGVKPGPNGLVTGRLDCRKNPGDPRCTPLAQSNHSDPNKQHDQPQTQQQKTPGPNTTPVEPPKKPTDKPVPTPTPVPPPAGGKDQGKPPVVDPNAHEAK
jgi:protein phosphatase